MQELLSFAALILVASIPFAASTAIDSILAIGSRNLFEKVFL